jgi:hypothetical protein
MLEMHTHSKDGNKKALKGVWKYQDSIWLKKPNHTLTIKERRLTHGRQKRSEGEEASL